MVSVSSASDTTSGSASIARLTATRLAVPPIHVAPIEASTRQPSAGSHHRQSIQATTMPARIETVEQNAASRMRGPRATTARRSQRTRSRNTSAGRRCVRIADLTASISGVDRQQPAMASAVDAA